MKIHINLADWKGTLTKWALLNYVDGGLDDYGFYINDSVKNYIDYENKKYIQKVGRVDLGSLTWNYDSHFGFYSSQLLTDAKLVSTDSQVCNLLCSLFETKSQSETISGNYGEAIALVVAKYTSVLGQIIVSTSKWTEPTTFKSAMSGVYLYYELATPIETDLSDYL